MTRLNSSLDSEQYVTKCLKKTFKHVGDQPKCIIIRDAPNMEF